MGNRGDEMGVIAFVVGAAVVVFLAALGASAWMNAYREWVKFKVEMGFEPARKPKKVREDA